MTTIFRNEENLATDQVVKIFGQKLQETSIYEESEIEQLATAYAKNPVDRFIISEQLNVEAAQGDILIWAENSQMYQKNIKKTSKLVKTDRLVLQEGDSLTGDHRIVLLEGTNYTLKKGEFAPTILKETWNRTYPCLTFETDKPFLIVHREHGNMALPAGKYMFCTALDSSTLTQMLD